MIKFLHKNWFLALALLPLCFSLFIGLVVDDFWQLIDEKNINITDLKAFVNIKKEILFVVGVGYTSLIFLYWIYKKRKEIFSKNEFFRSFLVFMFALILTIWLYAYIHVAHTSFILFYLCVFYGIYYKKIYEPTLPMVVLFLYGVLQIIGVLWYKKTFDSNIYWVLQDQFVLIGIPVVTCFFRPTQKEISIFFSIIFKFFLLLMVWYVVGYVLAVNSVDKNVFSCFSFNKDYMKPLSRMEVFQFSIYQHPSFVSWLLLIVGGGSYFSYRKHNINHSTKLEVITYWILLFCFVFIVQARVAQLGFFIVLTFVLFFEYSENISKKNKLVISIVGSCLLFVLLYNMIEHTSFFYDRIRIKLYLNTIKQIKESPFLGSGTFIELDVLKATGLTHPSFKHIHNDFLMAWLRHGILGITLLLLWVVLMFRNSIKSKDLRLFFFMLPTLLIMLTDSALYYQRILTITSVFLFMTYYPKPINTNQT